MCDNEKLIITQRYKNLLHNFGSYFQYKIWADLPISYNLKNLYNDRDNFFSFLTKNVWKLLNKMNLQKLKIYVLSDAKFNIINNIRL